MHFFLYVLRTLAVPCSFFFGGGESQGIIFGFRLWSSLENFSKGTILRHPKNKIILGPDSNSSSYHLSDVAGYDCFSTLTYTD